MERLRADPTITAAIALLPRSDCPALPQDALPVVCVGTVTDRSALGMASSTETLGAAAAALMTGLEVGRAALVVGDDLAGQSAAAAFASALSSSPVGGTEVAAWLEVAGTAAAPWSLVPYLSVARVNSSQPVGIAKAALPPGTTGAEAQSALLALQSLEAVLDAASATPLVSAVAMASGWEASAALMTEAHQRGLLAGKAWVDLLPAPSPLPVVAPANATVAAAVRQATRGRLSLRASPATSSAGVSRREAIRAAWASLPSWRSGLPPALNNTRQGLLEGWAAHGLASSSGTAAPDPDSLWQSSHDAAQAVLFALSRACAGGASSCAGGSGEVARAALLQAVVAASRLTGAGLVPAAVSALGGTPSPTLLGASSGMDVAVVNNDGTSEDPSSWREVARWRATGVLALAAPSSGQIVGGPVALAPRGMLVPAGGNGTAAFQGTPAALDGWFWPGAGTGPGSAPPLSVLLRVGLARRLSLNETDTAVASALAGMRNLSESLPRVLIHFTSDETQLQMSELRSGSDVVGDGEAGRIAQDANQLVAEAESLASRLFDVIVMAGDDDTTAAAAEQLATRHPRNTFLILRDGSSATADLPSNLVTVVFSDDQPSFVAGAVAASVALARAGRPVELPGETPNTGSTRRAVAGLDADGDGLPDSPGAGVRLASLHGPLSAATLRRVTSGFASGVRQLCPGCQLLDVPMLDARTSTSASTVQQGRTAAEELASRAEAPSVVLVSAMPEAVAAAAMEALARRGVMSVAPSLAALQAARSALLVSAPSRLPMLLGALQKTAAEVVQLVARQRSAANAAARSAAASSATMTVSVHGAAALDRQLLARAADARDSRRRTAEQTDGQVVTVGLLSGALSFALGQDLDSSSGSEFLATRVAARAAHAWARAGLLSGELQTEVFLASGAPFLQPTSCEIGEEFRQGAGGDPLLAQCFRCPQTTYSLTRGGVCQPCPEQGICEGGAHLAARYGHWIGEDLKTIYSCNAYSCCIEGNCSHPDNPALSAEDRALALATRCNNGRGGPICGSCPEGELLVSEANGCGECKHIQWIPVGLFLGGCAAFVLYMLLRNHDVRSASFSIAIDFLNTSLLVFSPARQFGFTISFGAATMELTAAPFSRDCVVPMTPLMRLMSPFVIPLALLLTLFLAWLFTVTAKGCCRLWGKRLEWGTWRSQLVLWVIITIAYSAFSRVGIEAITCRTVDGVDVVATAPDIVCSGVPYIIVASTTGAVAFLTLFGVPALVFYMNYSTLNALGVLNVGEVVFKAARVARVTTRAVQRLARRAIGARERVAARAAAAAAAGAPAAADAPAIQDKQPAERGTTSEVRAPSPTGATPSLPAGARRSSLAWEAEIAQMRAEALTMELDAASAPTRDLTASSRSQSGTKTAAPRGPADPMQRQRRRLSALGLAPDQRGWILDTESNGYFWLYGAAGKAPLGPFFVHPRFAAKPSPRSRGRAGADDAPGTGKRVAWSLVPEHRVEAAIASAKKLGSAKGLAVVLEPKSGQLVALSFQRPPPTKQLRMLAKRAMGSVSDDGASTTGSLAWAERSPGKPGGPMASRSMSHSPRAASGTTGAGKDAAGGAFRADLRASGTSLVSSSSGVERGHGTTSAAGVKLARSVTGPVAPTAGRRARGRRGSILNDPEKLRKAMALQFMVGRVSGAEAQLQDLVDEVHRDDSESEGHDSHEEDAGDEKQQRGDGTGAPQALSVDTKASARSLHSHATNVRHARTATTRESSRLALARTRSSSPRPVRSPTGSPRPVPKRAVMPDDVEAVGLRLKMIPPAFRGSARLFIPFRVRYRATGYAILLLRRGLATLAFVLLSQQPAIKQAILFLYFIGWLLWQISNSPFQEDLDNKFASVSLAVVVATAGLELHFISQVVGPAWVTWIQLVLLAIPVCYIAAIVIGEILDLADERGWLPQRCHISDKDAFGAIDRYGVRIRICGEICSDCLCPPQRMASFKRQCGWLIGCLRVVTCAGRLCCCCRVCCYRLLAKDSPRPNVLKRGKTSARPK
ncbi:hypothetical protein FNF29_04959 [Cafeteria roenbergensis]|uniref:Uncharacterized protein n=1 Tax=Cafeteria roenbergensis TaxID=33653 RepID=A0A5A8CD23_CAFRO|nr:hypothetical protein FNF29_04959 [Cafeteria roenbergensis]|eukprot:KAA0150845.1 hypothetical protein FNF29_04959 [Cafeteria roenbergensis]